MHKNPMRIEHDGSFRLQTLFEFDIKGAVLPETIWRPERILTGFSPDLRSGRMLRSSNLGSSGDADLPNRPNGVVRTARRVCRGDGLRLMQLHQRSLVPVHSCVSRPRRQGTIQKTSQFIISSPARVLGESAGNGGYAYAGEPPPIGFI